MTIERRAINAAETETPINQSINQSIKQTNCRSGKGALSDDDNRLTVKWAQPATCLQHATRAARAKQALTTGRLYTADMSIV